MPQVGLAISALATAFTSSAIGTFLTTTILGQLLTSVALSALSQALQSKPKAAGLRTSSTGAGAGNPVSFVMGQYATGGVASSPAMSHGDDGKTPNAFLTYVIDLGDIAGMVLDDMIIDGESITTSLGTDPDFPLYGRRILGDYADYAWVKYYNGSQTTADAGLVAKYGTYPERPWLTDMIGRGLCYAVCTFRYNREIYNNLPTCLFVVSGIPLYDPRKDTTVGGSGAQRWANRATWSPSNNPMVMIYNILRGVTLGDGTVWGGDAEAADLPLDNWFAAMNVCDVAVTVSGGTEPRYRAGVEVGVDDEPASVIEELLKSCSGQIVDMGGTWKVRAGGSGLPVYFMFDDDVIVSSPDDFSPFPGLDQTYNGVSASYPDPRALWQTQESPPRYSATYEAEDGGRRLVAALRLPTVPYPKQVQRLQKALLKDHRRMRRHSLTLPPSAAIIEPLDVVSWTSASNGYISKIFEVGGVTDSGQMLLQQLSMRERNPNDYDFDVADELPSSPAPGKKIRPAAQAVPGWAVTALTINDAGGNPRRPAIKISWTGVGQDDVEALEWEVRRAGTVEVVNSGSTHKVEQSQRVITGSILPATSYEVRGRFVMKRRRLWTSWVGVTTANVKIPKVDLSVEVIDYMSETALLAGIKPVSTLPASGDKIDQIVMKIPEGVLYRWNGTAWTRTLFGGIKPGDIDIASFAAGIRPTELFASLPATGNFNGRIVYRTSDKSLWRHDGTLWINTNAADQIVGELVAGQIAAGAISARELAANAVTVTNLAVSDFTNLIGNADFETDGAVSNEGWILQNGASIGAAPANAVGTYGLIFPATVNARAISAKFIPCKPDDEFYAYASVRASGPSPGSFTARVGGYFYDKTGAYLSARVADTVNITASYIDAEHTMVAPASAAYARFFVERPVAGTNAGYVERPQFKRRNNGTLIVDGTLKARHMATETIISNVAQLGTAVVTTAAIGDLQVNTLKIANNAVSTIVRSFDNTPAYIVKSTTETTGISTGMGPAVSIARTSGLVTRVDWSGVINPITSDSAKLAQVRIGIFRSKSGVLTNVAEAYLSSSNKRDTYVNINFVDADTSGGTVTYFTVWESTYHPDNVNCNLIRQILEASQFKK